MVLDLDKLEALYAAYVMPRGPLQCPNCGGVVKQTSSAGALSRDQFDAVKAGDYYCEKCPESAGTAGKAGTGYAYFWSDDIYGPRPTEAQLNSALRGAFPLMVDRIRTLEAVLETERHTLLKTMSDNAHMAFLLWGGIIENNYVVPPHQCVIHLGEGLLHDHCPTCGHNMIEGPRKPGRFPDWG